MDRILKGDYIMKKRHTIIVRKKEYKTVMKIVDKYAGYYVEVFSTPFHDEITFECDVIDWARFKKVIKKSGLRIEL